MSNNRGQAAIETVLSLACAGVAFCTLSAIAVLSFSRFWAQNQLYEAEICLAEHSAKSFCEQQLLSRLDSILPPYEVKELLLQAQTDEYYGKLKFDLRFLSGFPISVEKRFQLPFTH